VNVSVHEQTKPADGELLQLLPVELAQVELELRVLHGERGRRPVEIE
jgi:hypothetical protein